MGGLRAPPKPPNVRNRPGGAGAVLFSAVSQRDGGAPGGGGGTRAGAGGGGGLGTQTH